MYAVFFIFCYDRIIDKPIRVSAVPRKDKMNKAEILLYLFYQLISDKPVSRLAFCCDTHISERSFYRYLSDIKNFLVEFGIGLEIAEEGGNYTVKER